MLNSLYGSLPPPSSSSSSSKDTKTNNNILKDNNNKDDTKYNEKKKIHNNNNNNNNNNTKEKSKDVNVNKPTISFSMNNKVIMPRVLSMGVSKAPHNKTRIINNDAITARKVLKKHLISNSPRLIANKNEKSTSSTMQPLDLNVDDDNNNNKSLEDAMKPKPTDYNPAIPNTYDEFCRLREEKELEQQRKEDLKRRSIELERVQQKYSEKLKQISGSSAKLDLKVSSGDEILRRRQMLSQAMEQVQEEENRKFIEDSNANLYQKNPNDYYTHSSSSYQQHAHQNKYNHHPNKDKYDSHHSHYQDKDKYGSHHSHYQDKDKYDNHHSHHRNKDIYDNHHSHHRNKDKYGSYRKHDNYDRRDKYGNSNHNRNYGHSSSSPPRSRYERHNRYDRYDNNKKRRRDYSSSSPPRHSGHDRYGRTHKHDTPNNDSRVLLLRNLTGHRNVDDILINEIKSECNRYGRVSDVKYEIARDPNTPVIDAVRFYIKFYNEQDAYNTYKNLNGRFFDGRQLSVEFYAEHHYNDINQR